MLIRKLFKHRGMTINLFACASFLALAVYGWGLSLTDLFYYFVICAVCLVVLIGLAFGAGLILRKLMHKKNDD